MIPQQNSIFEEGRLEIANIILRVESYLARREKPEPKSQILRSSIISELFRTIETQVIRLVQEYSKKDHKFEMMPDMSDLEGVRALQEEAKALNSKLEKITSPKLNDLLPIASVQAKAEALLKEEDQQNMPEIKIDEAMIHNMLRSSVLFDGKPIVERKSQNSLQKEEKKESNATYLSLMCENCLRERTAGRLNLGFEDIESQALKNATECIQLYWKLKIECGVKEDLEKLEQAVKEAKDQMQGMFEQKDIKVLPQIEEVLRDLQRAESVEQVPLFEIKYALRQQRQDVPPILVNLIFSAHGFQFRVKPSREEEYKSDPVLSWEECKQLTESLKGDEFQEFSILSKVLAEIKKRLVNPDDNQQMEKRRLFLEALRNETKNFGALYDYDSLCHQNMSFLVRMQQTGDLVYFAIKLGFNFPNDYVKVEARLFGEIKNQLFAGTQALTKPKVFFYSTNGEYVKNFEDTDLYAAQAADLFEIIEDVAELAEQAQKHLVVGVMV